MAKPAQHHTVKSLATYWSCSTQHIYSMCSKRKLSHLRIGGSIRIPVSCVKNYEDQQWQSSQNEEISGISHMQTAQADQDGFQLALVSKDGTRAASCL